jgi:hypothetical protein
MKEGRKEGNRKGKKEKKKSFFTSLAFFSYYSLFFSRKSHPLPWVWLNMVEPLLSSSIPAFLTCISICLQNRTPIFTLLHIFSIYLTFQTNVTIFAPLFLSEIDPIHEIQLSKPLLQEMF